MQDLLAAKGYTQVQKGDEIIKLEPSAQADSTLESTTQISQEIKDIIDSSPAKGRDMQIIGEANFTPQVVEYAHKNSKKVAIDKLDKAEAERLGFKHPQDVRVTIDYQAINHTLNRHGAESAFVKNSGQKAVDYTDIAEYRNIVKGADESLDSVDNLGQEVIVSFKQINGHAVVVESIRKKGNELAFKSMYFENGSYKNSNAYKNAVDNQKANPSPAPYGYEPHADANTPPLKTDTDIIPQKTQKSLFDTQEATPPKVDSSEAPPSKINFTYTTGEAKGIAELRKDLKATLEPYKSTPITNKETGLQGVITTDEINKIASKKAVDKSVANGFSRDEHFTAAQDLKNLFENSKLKESHADNKHRENIKVHRFIKDLHINDKPAQAKITLFEKIEGKNRIYTLELESLNKPDSLSVSVPNTESAAKAQSVATAHPETTTIAKTDGESIAQDSNALLESTMKKFNYDERKAKDLLEWHKDSSPLTKDENGLPKVFYHGTSSDKVFEVFNKDKIHSGYGFWFGDDIADRAVKENTTGKAPIIKAFLQMKKPFIFSNQGITAQNIDEYAYITGISKKRITELYEAKEAFNTLEKMIQRDTQADYVWAGAVDYFEIEKGGKELNIFDYRQLDLSDQTIAFLDRMRTKGITARGIDINPTRQYESAQEARETLERLKEKGYDSMVYANSEFVVFDSNQIKHIENRGVESESGRKYFNDSSPNIFHSNPHLGAGLLGGSVAGVEQDENGSYTFSPEKFALGLLGGTAGSKAIAKGLEWRARKVAKSYPNIAKDNPQLMREIAKRDLHTYATASTHNALSRFLHNNKLFDINPQLFAGEKALANEAYAPHKARLENAKELEAKGAKEIEIWEQTGWYKDKDQRWKFEISQRGGELLTKDEFGRPYKRAFLSKILQDDELFNAYPKLKNMLVIEDKKLGRGVNASYDPKLKDIYIKNLQAKEAKLTLYHELQHAIQDIEGFAYGFKDYVTSDENFHKYAIQHGEVEARNVESRMNLPTKKDVQILKRAAKNTDKQIEDLKTSDYEEWYKNERINTEQSKKKDFLAKAQATQEVINQGKYTDHPHETMDTPLENTIAEATMHGEALSKKLGDKAGDTLKSTPKVQGESKEMQQQLQSTIQTHLENLPPNPTPQPINEAKIKALIKRFDNIENLQEHLNTRADTKARQEIFSLLDDTLQTPQVHYKKDGKDKYLKRYKSERKEPYFYLLVTKDENKTFITHFKTRDSKYLSKEITKAQEIIQGADIIEALSQRTGDI